jgi:hypothetical protein
MRRNRHYLHLAQLPATLAILAWSPSNAARLVAMLALWGFTFRRVTAAEAGLFGFGCVFFTAMNVLSLRQGIFAFTDPDLLGLPVYELCLWGFYLLHAWRVLGGAAPERPGVSTWLLAGLYALAFATLPDPDLLLVATGVLLAVALVLCHEPLDLAYAGYMVLVGAAVEYVGVWSGQWHYPADPPGGVPLWFVTLWGGVGLFLRRLVLPYLVARNAPAAGA